MTPATVPPLVIRFAAEVIVGRYSKRQRVEGIGQEGAPSSNDVNSCGGGGLVVR
jgi:hypothetical protein